MVWTGFFFKIRALFSILKKVQGKLPPPSYSSYVTGILLIKNKFCNTACTSIFLLHIPSVKTIYKK